MDPGSESPILTAAVVFGLYAWGSLAHGGSRRELAKRPPK